MYLSKVTRHYEGGASVCRYQYEAIPRSGSRASSKMRLCGGGGSKIGAKVVTRFSRSNEDEERRRSVLSQKTDANGMWTEYEYDRLGDSLAVRCTSTCMKDGLFDEEFGRSPSMATIRRKVSDGRSNQTIVNIDGRQRETKRQLGRELRYRTYDNRGDLVLEVVSDTATGHFLASWRSYDERHRMTTFKTVLDAPPGEPFSFLWDDAAGVPGVPQ